MARPPKRLDRRCEILALVRGKDSDGGPTINYVVQGGPRYCHREDKAGSENRTADALRSEGTSIFTLAWFSGLSAEHKIRCEGVDYDIVGKPAELGRRQFYLVQTKDRPAQYPL